MALLKRLRCANARNAVWSTTALDFTCVCVVRVRAGLGLGLGCTVAGSGDGPGFRVRTRFRVTTSATLIVLFSNLFGKCVVRTRARVR